MSELELWDQDEDVRKVLSILFNTAQHYKTRTVRWSIHGVARHLKGPQFRAVAVLRRMRSNGLIAYSLPKCCQKARFEIYLLRNIVVDKAGALRTAGRASADGEKDTGVNRG